MIKKLFARLVANLQPRMNLGQQRFNEGEARESELSKEREREARERMRVEDEKKWQEVKENPEQA